MNDLIEKLLEAGRQKIGPFAPYETLYHKAVNRIKELETERDQFMEQAALRDQRDIDMQEIMRINNALKAERDVLADHLARAQVELARFLRPIKELVTLTEEPTEAMLNAARDWSLAKYGKPIGNDAAIGCWKAMLKASKL